MSKSHKKITASSKAAKERIPLFSPHQFHLYFQRRVDDLVRIELYAYFQKMFWGETFDGK